MIIEVGQLYKYSDLKEVRHLGRGLDLTGYVLVTKVEPSLNNHGEFRYTFLWLGENGTLEDYSSEYFFKKCILIAG